ncbi:MFS transporter [Anatilimnocola floriformis]|uniref:MFS transporter n=1 Tax=Anatilimnocola floriformis TaxID=2948575 RepID=UPI0020C2B474|nr:MFS transporter [Anatilimnocola floriformis]
MSRPLLSAEPPEKGGSREQLNPYASPAEASAPIVPDPAAIAAAAVRRQEMLILLVLAAIQFTAIVDFVVVMPLGPELMKALKIGPFEYGLIVESYTFAAGIAGLVAAALVDRFSRRSAFLTLFAGFLIGTLCCALAPNYQLLIAARAVTGFFGGILGGMAMAIVGDVFPEERRGRATGALMSAFAIASIMGVPFGLMLGQNFGWHVPFVALVILGIPVFALAAVTLPPLRDHLAKSHTPPLQALLQTFQSSSNLNAFALMGALMIGSFAVIPYINPYLVANVGVPKAYLPLVYFTGGLLTLIISPIVGRLADRFGKLLMFRITAPLSALMLIAVTFLPPLPPLLAVLVVSGLIVTNSGRMIAAMAMITGTVPPQQRGAFLSANASMQHIASGLGTLLASYVVTEAADGHLQHFGTVGLFACAITLFSIWIAGRLRQPVTSARPISMETELAAVSAAEHG